MSMHDSRLQLVLHQQWHLQSCAGDNQSTVSAAAAATHNHRRHNCPRHIDSAVAVEDHVTVRNVSSTKCSAVSVTYSWSCMHDVGTMSRTSLEQNVVKSMDSNELLTIDSSAENSEDEFEWIRRQTQCYSQTVSVLSRPGLGQDWCVLQDFLVPVSYTHLTLPTNREV